MSTLNSLFDVVRGWPGTGTDSATITEDFKPSTSIDADNPLREGSIVFVGSDGRVDRATSSDLSAGADADALAAAIAQHQQFWLVVDGNEDENYDTLQQTGPVQGNGAPSYVPWKVTCIRGTYMVETENFVSGRPYTPGEATAVVDGELDRVADTDGAGGSMYPYGEIREYDAAQEVLTVTV